MMSPLLVESVGFQDLFKNTQQSINTKEDLKRMIEDHFDKLKRDLDFDAMAGR